MSSKIFQQAGLERPIVLWIIVRAKGDAGTAGLCFGQVKGSLVRSTCTSYGTAPSLGTGLAFTLALSF